MGLPVEGEATPPSVQHRKHMAVFKKPIKANKAKRILIEYQLNVVMLMFFNILGEVFQFQVSAERARHGHGTGTQMIFVQI